ncbi:nucleotide-binding universal stress UspA family protein [Phenylobacterium haematophilum]|uniref:Nucleotide-binding universal stress UspA family protein n=1 Tax=Phenylobacterium haematophilum TaxID=98513 RepID=A0A840A7S6_9CAUL|nr:universal stress protein [Phenylobacterium haematophilum]MBB3893392.1 nucleotide-binding universal stress UspA family protein [Phenylobacterium haematophilum]
MAFADLLLPVLSYPDSTPDRAIRAGVALAKRLGGELTLLTMRVDIPKFGNVLANALIDLDRQGELEEARSAATARLEALCAQVAAETFGEPLRVETRCASLYEEGDAVARAARTYDLCLTPQGAAVEGDRSLAEAVLFGSGRPVLLYPDDQEFAPGSGVGKVAIAWDGSVRAARAVADALPLLARASEVRVFVALGEKPQAASGSASDLLRHLEAHGVSASADERPSQGQSIGVSMANYVRTEGVDLLVMGGFGHARIRQFVLGGATDAVLKAPPCPVLISH